MAPWGRVDETGTVYVREADGERVVGQYPDGTPEEALAYFERKFTELAGQVTLLEQRVKRGAPAADVAKTVKTLSATIATANAVGNLAALNTRLEALGGTVTELTEKQSEEAKALVAAALAEREALVAEAESLIVRVEARRGDDLYINDGSYGALFDAAHLGFVFPARLCSREVEPGEPMMGFELWGPTCDSLDHMKGPFMLPASIREGDYIEICSIGAYGRAISGQFNGYGVYDEVILEDEPMMTMYGNDEDGRVVQQG